ncbi:MAG: formate/nitrite transporter family protein [Gammaproteobacteria bacterium]|nr:formate/nitrite transporter family protein [Gammaproteobacteria bacterium]
MQTSVPLAGAVPSRSARGAMIGMSMPVVVLFGLGFERAVVYMYLFPLGMVTGAEITMPGWRIRDEIPVTPGDSVGDPLLAGRVLRAAHVRPRRGRRGSRR